MSLGSVRSGMDNWSTDSVGTWEQSYSCMNTMTVQASNKKKTPSKLISQNIKSRYLTFVAWMRWMQRYEEQYLLLCTLPSILCQEHTIPFSEPGLIFPWMSGCKQTVSSPRHMTDSLKSRWSPSNPNAPHFNGEREMQESIHISFGVQDSILPFNFPFCAPWFLCESSSCCFYYCCFQQGCSLLCCCHCGRAVDEEQQQQPPLQTSPVLGLPVYMWSVHKSDPFSF